MPPRRIWSVYVLECRDGSLYTGIAIDVAARLQAHQAGAGARYTRGRGPLRLVYSRAVGTRSEALTSECAIKRLTRPQKLALLKRSPKADCGSL